MSIKKTKKASNLNLLLCVGLVIIIGFAGIKLFQKYQYTQKEQKSMLKELVLVEGRFNTIGPYMVLFTWFQTLEKIEDYHYTYHNEYLNTSEITENMFQSTDPSQVLKGVRTMFWNEGMLLDVFVPYDSLKASIYQHFGKYHCNFLEWPDTSGYRYSFELAKDKKSYQVRVYETMDHTLDNDTADYWTFDSKSKQIRFHDKENQMTVEQRLRNYVKVFIPEANYE